MVLLSKATAVTSKRLVWYAKLVFALLSWKKKKKVTQILIYRNLKKEKKKLGQANFYGKSLIPAEHTITAFYAKKTIDALERLKNKPFSITTSFHFPHAPMIPSEPYYSMYNPKDMPVPISINDNMENSPYKNANGRKRRLERVNERITRNEYRPVRFC